MSTESGTPKAPPIPAIAANAPGVSDARSIPKGQMLQTGDIISNRYMVNRYLGSSDGVVSYLCHDNKRDREAVLKIIASSLLVGNLSAELTAQVQRAASLGQHPNLSSIYGMGKVDAKNIFVSFEFLQGHSLSRLVSKRREAGRNVDLRDIYTVLKHCTNILEVVHQQMAHGVLTPYNIYVSRDGVLKITNLAFGHVTARMLHAVGKGPLFDSIYVAPEMTIDPEQLSPASDVYSLAMIAIDLLNPEGLPADRQLASRATSKVLAEYPPKMTQMLMSALDAQPSRRPALSDLVRVIREEAQRQDVLLGHPPVKGQLPIKPAMAPEVIEDAVVEEEEDIFNIPELSVNSARPANFSDFGDEEEERYLVQKNGLDYGPFTKEKVFEQLHSDEINENTQVLDRFTQERMALEDMHAFSEGVREYIPKREARRQADAERRAEIQQKVKKGGVAFLAVGIVASLMVLGGMIYVLVTRPDPQPLPMETAFASMDYKLLPPPKDFEEVKVDKELINSIFNPKASEEEIAKTLKKIRRKRRGSSGRKPSGSKGGSGDENVTEVDMSGGATDGRILSDGEINEIILARFGSLRRCIIKELNVDPGFKGATVQFFIRPSGTTGGVKIRQAKYRKKAVGACLVSRFRAMKFPKHSGFNKGVTFPLLVQ